MLNKFVKKICSLKLMFHLCTIEGAERNNIKQDSVCYMLIGVWLLVGRVWHHDACFILSNMPSDRWCSSSVTYCVSRIQVVSSRHAIGTLSFVGVSVKFCDAYHDFTQSTWEILLYKKRWFYYFKSYLKFGLLEYHVIFIPWSTKFYGDTRKSPLCVLNSKF